MKKTLATLLLFTSVLGSFLFTSNNTAILDYTALKDNVVSTYDEEQPPSN